MLQRIKKADVIEEIITREQFTLSLEIENTSHDILVNKRIEEFLRASSSKYIKIDKENITISRDFFSRENHVPNVYRYVLNKKEKHFTLYHFAESHSDHQDSSFADRNIEEEIDLPTIVLVLESPHEDEFRYEGDTLTPIAPAQGVTGNLIYAKLDELLNYSNVLDAIEDCEYRVVLVNPIPVQTSLVSLHKKSLSGVYKTLRDKVWVELWKKSKHYETDFMVELDKINPRIILNCCTAKLSPYISEKIPSKYEVIEIHHPSSWWRDNKQILIRPRDKK